MKNYFVLGARRVGGVIASNKRLYLICGLCVLAGLIFGAYLVLAGQMEELVYSSSTAELAEVIMGESGFLGLVFSNIKQLLVPMLIIVLITTNKYTSILTFFYLGYQGVLLGGSVVSIVLEYGIGGIVMIVCFLLPMNFANFFVLISWVITHYKRLMVSRMQRINFLYSIKVFIKPIAGVLLGAVVASLCFGILYPLLLRSAVVVLV